MNNLKKQINFKDESFKKILKIANPIKKDFEEIYSNLTEEQIEFLKRYKAGESGLLNRFLTRNNISLIFNSIKSLDEIIKESYNSYLHAIKILDSVFSYKSKNKINTFRGLSQNSNLLLPTLQAKMISELKENDTYLFKNFMSTSLNPNVAFNFSTQSFKDNDNEIKILLDLQLPKNFKFFYLTWFIGNYHSGGWGPSAAPWVKDLNNFNKNNTNKSKKKESKKNNFKEKSIKSIKKEKLNLSEFELVLPRNCLFKLTKVSTIEERYFSYSDTDWENYEKYLNTNNKVKKIKVYHLKFIKIEDTPLPNINDITFNKIDLPLEYLYYIPPKEKISW